MSFKVRWTLRAAAVLFAGGVVGVFMPVSANPPVEVDTSLFSEIQATRGGEVLASHCAVCHGAELTGGGGAPSLNGPDFLFGWSQKTTKDLVEYISNTMPPGQSHALTDREYEDAAAYILKVNGFQAGDSALRPTNPIPIGEPPEPS